MITLQSIRVRNFRAIAEATFRPLDEGITGIFGSNGAGKTTFLAATLFALYGVRPPGASQNSLRRMGSTGECSVSVLFKHLGQQVEIIREIKGTNNRIIVNIYVDGVPQTVTSVGAADSWIKQRLGIDATGFMTAFVVRQKELDQLVNAKPAERKAIIERLAGIDTINAALKAAREDENGAKKVLLTLPGSQAQVDETGEQLDTTSNRYTKMSEEYTTKEAALKVLADNVKALREKFDAYRQSELLVNTLKTKIDSSTTELESITRQLDGYKGVKFDEVPDIEALRQKHRELTNSIEEMNAQVQKLSVELGSTANEKNRLEGLKATVELKLKVTVKPSDSVATLEASAESNRLSISEKESFIQSQLNRRKDFEDAIATLGHSTECPTCQQDVPHPEKIISTMQSAIEDINSAVASARTELDALKTTQASLREEVIAAETVDKLTGELTEINTALAALPDASETEAEVDKLKEDVLLLEEQRNSVTEEGLRAKNIERDRTAYNELVSRKITLEDNLSAASTEIETLSKKLGGKEALDSEARLNKAVNEYESAKDKLAELSNEKHAVDVRLGILKTSFKAAEESWNRKKELLSKQEQLALTTDLLDKFRGDAIGTLAPELSEFATSLISDMTNGDFVEIRLDEEFNPSVVDSAGKERPVSWLSGGEESAVALALRIAIAFLITGGNPQLLWLDEVLTAQDADRRNTMLSMIRGLPIDQIIMINHTQEAGDIVDKAVTIMPNLDEGSRIEDQAPEEA